MIRRMTDQTNDRPQGNPVQICEGDFAADDPVSCDEHAHSRRTLYDPVRVKAAMRGAEASDIVHDHSCRRMVRERWPKIEEIYHEAPMRPAERRKRNYTAIIVILPFTTRAPFAGGTLYSISSRRLFL